ncbi:hypothetical protein ACFUG9_28545 [Streptomyces griseoincarnatus]|uniref:hypothetical protein n=1 Tax=Streptomyces sp. enrichment culture TaxID=1795815 RepID=UPI00363A824A
MHKPADRQPLNTYGVRNSFVVVLDSTALTHQVPSRGARFLSALAAVAVPIDVLIKATDLLQRWI